MKNALQDHMASDSHGCVAQDGYPVLQMTVPGIEPVRSEVEMIKSGAM